MTLALALLLLHQAPQMITLEVDHETRQALVYSPSSPSAHPPVIFAFHGHMGNSRYAANAYKLQELWPEAVVVYPQGLPTKGMTDPAGRFNGWTAGASEDNRDIRFFDLLYKAVMMSQHGDPKHVFAMGHSNGGEFMYTLWAMRGSEFAAFGSFEGAGARRVRLTPKPLFITIGSEDKIVPPMLQQASLRAVFTVDKSASQGQPYGEKGTIYQGTQPVVFWSYEGGHEFPADALPTMIKFFKSID